MCSYTGVRVRNPYYGCQLAVWQRLCQHRSLLHCKACTTLSCESPVLLSRAYSIKTKRECMSLIMSVQDTTWVCIATSVLNFKVIVYSLKHSLSNWKGSAISLRYGGDLSQHRAVGEGGRGQHTLRLACILNQNQKCLGDPSQHRKM